MMDRAYSLLQVKELHEEQRIIRGIATSPTPDRVGDVVEPAGVKVAPDIPLLLHHDSRQVVGRARFGKATANGIPFEASLPKIAEPGTLKDRVDEAWGLVKHRLITGVSIGFRAIADKTERLSSGGIRFLETEILELSLVAIPANLEATITAVKDLASGSPMDRSADPMEAFERAYAANDVDAMKTIATSKPFTDVLGRRAVKHLKEQNILAGGEGHWPGWSVVQKQIASLAVALFVYMEHRQTITKIQRARTKKLEARIEELESQPPFRYDGPHESGKTYCKGTFVTFGGSVWHAQYKTSSRPGDGPAWVLAVKHGRDLR